MAIFNVRLPDDLAARFDAAAALDGGRSALLRRLIASAAVDTAPDRAAGRNVRSHKLTIRLSVEDAGGLAAAARDLGLTPHAWVAALVRRRLTGRPCFGREGEASLAAIQTELRRIGLNLNQVARALNAAVLEGQGIAPTALQVDALREALQAQVAGLRETLRGNLESWDVDW